jgi:hypothetical protein
MTYTIANTLLTKLNALNTVTVTDISDDETRYEITVDLGTGWAGEYEGGYWADAVRITDDSLKFVTSVYANDWDDAADALNYNFNEGVVYLHYADFGSGNLAYTSALENAINAAVAERTNGLLDVDGSEQGMQGYDEEDCCYLSLDVGTDCAGDELTAAQRAAITQHNNELRAKYATA